MAEHVVVGVVLAAALVILVVVIRRIHKRDAEIKFRVQRLAKAVKDPSNGAFAAIASEMGKRS